MPHLILNSTPVELPATDTNLLDWLRDRGLVATKPGCRTGDCGACQVLVGDAPAGEAVGYRVLNSCLLSTGLVADCHVVTLEGLAADANPVQRALVEGRAIQCGYCTPGLVVALTGGLLAGVPPLAAVEGNLCRCTGYADIRRAADTIEQIFPTLARTLAEAAELGLVSRPVAQAGQDLPQLPAEDASDLAAVRFVAGNTDAALHQVGAGDPRRPLRLRYLPGLRGITEDADTISIGAAVTIAELAVNPLVRRAWPGLVDALELFGSPAIRNAATVGGNLANASSVADLAVLLLALDANVHLDGPEGRRVLPLTQFHLDYKRTALRPHELIVAVSVPANRDGTARLHFEKVARRAHDDIATVCSALLAAATTTRLSAGGVGPVPLLLSEPTDLAALPGQISPIDDVRGTADYRTRLLQHQVLAHLAALDADFDPLRRLP